ncbi:MAG: response regulator transcription factor [Gaiellaceae bacterium]
MRKLMVPVLVLVVAVGVASAATARGVRTPPLIGGFAHGKAVNYLLTDVSARKDAVALSKATGYPVTFVPQLARVPDAALAKLYLFTNGVKGPNPFGFQANVLDSVPGDRGYSPLWRVYTVTWKSPSAARLLKSEGQVLAAQKAGRLTLKRTGLVNNSPVVGFGSGPARVRAGPDFMLLQGVLPHNGGMTTVLVVDDESIVRDVVVRYLRREGYRTLEAADGVRARELVEAESPSLVVLDLMLPGVDGLELCRWIRERSDLPVIMLTARGEEADRIVGLELGADDYVTKPFSPRELAARVRTVLRRAAPADLARDRLSFDGLEIDPATRDVTRSGRLLELTAKEFDLLWFLASHPRQVFSRDQLMDRVWGYEPAFDTGTVTVHVRRLREKIEEEPSRPRRLETVWGVGYRFCP